MASLHSSEEEHVAQPDLLQLEELFKTMKNEVQVLFFFDPRGNTEIHDFIRQIMRMIRQVAPRVGLREFSLQHELAAKYQVAKAPALVFAPDTHKIVWYGAPLGEQGRTLVELLLLLGTGNSKLKSASEKVLRSINNPRKIKVFVSPTCPYCPQQTVNAIRSVVFNPKIFSLEIIDVQLHSSLAEPYNAFSVPQVWANEQLIALGAQSEELFVLSLAKLEQQTFFIPEDTAEKVKADLVIVGGGPAGLTAGIYGKRSGLETVIIEKSALGGQIATTPIVENYPGLTHVGGKTLVDILVNHALEYVRIYPDESVYEITPPVHKGDPLVVKTSRRKFQSKAVLLATGAEHRKLGLPGETQFSGRGISYCSTCDGPLFRGKKVIMVGGGNSAVTESLYLKNIGVDVTVVHRRDTFRAQEHLVRILNSSAIPVLFNTEVQEIKGKDRVTSVVLRNNKTGEITSRAVDGLFIAIGYDPATDLAAKAGVRLNENGYIAKDARHRTSVPGIYSAGDVEGGYKQIVVAAGQGAEAAMTIFEDLIHPYWKTEAES